MRVRVPPAATLHRTGHQMVADLVLHPLCCSCCDRLAATELVLGQIAEQADYALSSPDASWAHGMREILRLATEKAYSAKCEECGGSGFVEGTWGASGEGAPCPRGCKAADLNSAKQGETNG